MAEWRNVLSLENQARYEELSAARYAPELKLWLEGGRRAADPKATLP
jgi:hypothetical protein